MYVIDNFIGKTGNIRNVSLELLSDPNKVDFRISEKQSVTFV